MQTVKDILEKKICELSEQKTGKPKRNITQEFQDFGMRIAHQLNDTAHKALYINYAKQVPRALMQDALNFASDYPKAKNKSRIFMWKLHELIAEYKLDHPEFTYSIRKKKSADKPKKSKAKNLKDKNSENLSFF